jgi:hypothetical protein
MIVGYSRRLSMKRLNAILIAGLILLTSGCSRGVKEDELRVSEPEVTASVDKEVATVVPKLQSCWSRLQGKGEIGFKYTYRRSGTNWVWNRQEVENSTLAKDQEPIALQCMAEAVRDTSFPMEAAEAARMGGFGGGVIARAQ